MKHLFLSLICFLLCTQLSQAQVILENGKVFEWAGTYDYMDDDLNIYKLTITGYEGEFTAELEYKDAKPFYKIKCTVVPEQDYKLLEVQFEEQLSGKFSELDKMHEMMEQTRTAPVLFTLTIDPTTEIVTTSLYELTVKGEKAGKEAIIFERQENTK